MENKLEDSLEEQYKYSTYLIGSMEKTAEGDDGQGSRDEVEKELEARNVLGINPVKLEASKTGMNVGEAKERMTGWVVSGNWELFKEKAIEIWKGCNAINENGGLIHIMGDVDYVLMSDWITMSIRRNDAPCGTYAEAGIALEHNIPIYLITNIIKRELPKSLLQIVLSSGGEVFNSLKEYLEFIDREYKLKKKEKK